MSQTLTPTAAEQALLDQVTIPAFFEKVASVSGISPSSPEASQMACHYGDLVAPAVGMYIREKIANQSAESDRLVKAAFDATLDVAGVQRKQASEPAESFLKLDGLRDAALTVVDDMAKRAAMTNNPIPPTAPAVGNEEDDDKKTEVETPAA